MYENVYIKGQAELLLSSTDLSEDIAFFTTIGFRLDQIFPSDDPAVARMSGHGMMIRIDKACTTTPPVLHILSDDPRATDSNDIKAPNGTIIRYKSATYQVEIPHSQHRFEVRRLRDSAPWVIGRAGMLYRDLIPDRLGGSIIASHIRIPDAGPVPDVVHYHTIGFQLIYCYKGWVRLVYEDQGPPFILEAGDCVTQPPQIRHRVLESSENLEVIEIGVPAEHMTTIDHDMALPTANVIPDREFGGQVFCHHKLKEALWEDWSKDGFEVRDTGIAQATRGVASVQVIRKATMVTDVSTLIHKGDILFTFVLEGELSLTVGEESQELQAGDAFVIPPHSEYSFHKASDNLQLLEVSLPGVSTK